MERHAILVMDCKNTTHPKDLSNPLLLGVHDIKVKSAIFLT